jgi:ribosome maturation factor RimP
VRDHEDFALPFAGIAKAQAALRSDGRRRVVHVTIAGEQDTPVDATTALHASLRAALASFGDPFLPVVLAPRERSLLLVSAGVRVLDDHRWATVEPAVRARLLEAFGFDAQGLAVPVVASRVLSVIQATPGVAYADLDVLHAVSETIDPSALATLVEDLAGPGQPPPAIPARPARLTPEGLRAAELLYLSAQVPDTLLLQELPS